MSAELDRLVERAKTDRQFLYDLLDDPKRAVADFKLDDSELRTIVGANTAGRLGGLVDIKLVAAGCGSSGTCEKTCAATCTVTFTSIVRGQEVINPA